MTVQQETVLRRRRFARILKTAFATSALISIISLTNSAMGQSSSCGVEQAYPSCGTELADPSCGCESPLIKQSSASKGPLCYRPRSLSFAEKFLKHLDRVGDQVEWEASQKGCSTCTCGHTPSTVVGGPSCGCESPSGSLAVGLPACGCGPSVPFGVPTTTRSTTLPQANQPFANNGSRAGQGGQIGLPANNAPMFPGKPKDSQALGKISDNGTISPKLEKPVTAPVPQPNAVDSSEASKSDKTIKQEPTPKAPFADAPKSNPKKPSDGRPVLKPIPTEETSSLPNESPIDSLPSAPPAELPPALPQSQDEIPDVLIDPFKDDASWKGNRNRLNGVRLISSETTNPLRTNTKPSVESQPKLLPTPHNDDVSTHDEPAPVVVKPTLINRYRSMETELNPKVNRVAVPKQRN